MFFFFFSSRRRHTRLQGDWSSDVCSSDLGRPNWGKVAGALELVDAARAEGLDVMADVYPYTASSTTLRTLLPDWTLEGGIDAMLKRLADPEDRARIRRDI